MLTRRLLYSIVICQLVFVVACRQSMAPAVPMIADPSALDAVLDRYVSDSLYPVLYARIEDLDGKVLYEHSVQNAGLVPDAVIDGDTWFRIWSMSKIVTISVVLDLMEDGVLSLSDAVAKYLPELAELQVAVAPDGHPLVGAGVDGGVTRCPLQLVDTDSVMTIDHLLNHQAGFYYATTGIACLDELMAAQDLPSAANSAELIERLARLPLIQHPGAGYHYGTNTTVLGIVAERATGYSLRQLVEERITGPLNISGLQYGLPAGERLLPQFIGTDTVLRRAEPGELDIFGPTVPDYEIAHALYLGGEGMVATADGYTDFLRMLAQYGILNGHRFLDQASVEAVYAPHTQLDNPDGHNGYNLWVSSEALREKGEGDAGLWMGGGYESTFFWVDPKRDFVAVVFSQNKCATARGDDLNGDFRRALYGQLYKLDSN